MLKSFLNSLNQLLVKPIFADEPADGVLRNPVIGNLGNDPAGAKSGALFISYAVQLWRVVINIGALIVLVYYIIAAYEWLTSGDDTKGVDKAKTRFTHATIGLILLVASFVIVSFVGSLLFGEEFDLLDLTFPSG